MRSSDEMCEQADIMKQDFTELRAEMVANQLIPRGITDPAVLQAMREVPRELFVSQAFVSSAYEDRPLPIAEGQTISQPFTVALMIEALHLKLGSKVLEIGTGSGYAAAVLAQIAAEVFTIERHVKLAKKAKELFTQLSYKNIQTKVGDGTLGWLEHAPYDGIIVSAAAPDVPEPFVNQIKIGANIIIPIETSRFSQELFRVYRTAEGSYQKECLGKVRFVPLIGEKGWPKD